MNVKKYLKTNEFFVLIALVILCAFIGFRNPVSEDFFSDSPAKKLTYKCRGKLRGRPT